MRSILFRASALIALTAVVFGAVPSVLHAAFQATDGVGQIRSGAPVFTINGANNSPNDLGLSSPQGIALDAAGRRMFVADSENGRVLVYSLTATGTLASYIPTHVLGQPDLFSNPDVSASATSTGILAGLAYDATDKRLFVVDGGNNRVLVYNVATSTITNGQAATHVLGQPDFTTTSSGFTTSKMNVPSAVVFDPSRQLLFVTERSSNRVSAYGVATSSIASGEASTYRLGTLATSAQADPSISSSSVNEAYAVAYDASNDRLFVADDSAFRVLIFDMDNLANLMGATRVLGQVNFTANGAPLTASTTVGTPRGLAYDPSRAFLFVSNGNRISVFDANPALTANNPGAVNVIGQFDFTSSNAGTSSSTVSSVTHLAYDETNDLLWISDAGNNRLLAYDVDVITNGEGAINVAGHSINGVPSYVYQGANNGPGTTGLQDNRMVAVDETNHRFFVADATNNRVVVFNLNSSNAFPDYEADYVLGQPDFYTDTADTSASKMSVPVGLAVDAPGNRLFVAEASGDVENLRVLVFDTSSLATGMDADYVLGQPDFTTSGQAATTSPRSIGGPEGMVYDQIDQRLFVADNSWSRVLVFDVSPGSMADNKPASYVIGQTNFASSTNSVTSSTFSNPKGLAYTASTSRLFVADGSNNRILVFNVATSTMANGQAATHVLGQPNFTSSDPGTSSSTLRDMNGLAYDPKHQRVFVADTSNNRVLGFNVNPDTIESGAPARVVLGQSDFSSSAGGTSATSMNGPAAVAYDASNNRIYVSDSGNHRVLAFDHIKITTVALPAATVGQAYSQDIAVENEQGTVAFTLAAGSLPGGISIGSVEGTPTAAGSYMFTVEASDSVNSAGSLVDFQSYTLTVAAATGQSSGGFIALGNYSGGGGGAPAPVSIPATTTSPSGSSGIESLRAQIATLLAQIASLQAQLGIPTGTGGVVTNAFTRDLETGDTGADVKALQIYLNTHGFPLASSGPGSPGNETERFGALTRSALSRFQAANGISPAAGYFGPITRAFLLENP